MGLGPRFSETRDVYVIGRAGLPGGDNGVRSLCIFITSVKYCHGVGRFLKLQENIMI